MTKKRKAAKNPQDSTLRNTRAAVKRIAELEGAVEILQDSVKAMRGEIAELQAKVMPPAEPAPNG